METKNEDQKTTKPNNSMKLVYGLISTALISYSLAATITYKNFKQEVSSKFDSLYRVTEELDYQLAANKVIKAEDVGDRLLIHHRGGEPTILYRELSNEYVTDYLTQRSVSVRALHNL